MGGGQSRECPVTPTVSVTNVWLVESVSIGIDIAIGVGYDFEAGSVLGLGLMFGPFHRLRSPVCS